MFSGIIEATARVKRVEKAPGILRIFVEKPSYFNDIKTGDSIAVNGVCLTVEDIQNESLSFALAAETLQVLGLNSGEAETFMHRPLNLERSLRFGDRIHGHLVTGHVDSLGEIVSRQQEGESLLLQVAVKDNLRPYFWNKGSVALNGVSLTVNKVEGSVLSLCLIPETQKRTNLGDVKIGDNVTVEIDMMARALTREQPL